MLNHTLRMSRIAVGLVLIALGAVLSLPLIPGPGLLCIFVGLTVLSSEFAWARRLRDRIHDSVRQFTGRSHGK